MKSLSRRPFERVRFAKQRGVVLFFALVSLLAIMLAAVALIRSVDTSTLIAGNLAFKQAATTSGDAGTEAALTWLDQTNKDPANLAKKVYMEKAHSFNVDDPTKGYYSSTNPALNLFTDAAWNAITAIPPITDSSGNTIQYIIQRTCRNNNVAIIAVPPDPAADCLFSGAVKDKSGQDIKLPQNICDGPGCPVLGQTPMIRITSRVKGPRNTLSYIQAFVY